ncbi:FMN-dependent NADH-azoreductase [Roseibium sp. SCP14]|uniref:FMN-dependent NADH-azoreductase n=1 Tax=Roseibium sp. SCP14 TaxID=3141375 RepID=UPI00333A6243
MPHSVLRIDSSARTEGSVSRDLTDRVIARLSPDTVVSRDLADGLPLIDNSWIGANMTSADDRNDEQRNLLALSDTLIAELKAADTVVIGVPVYNFGIPAALKAWIDLITRHGVTFNYTETGPAGTLTGKRAILAMASAMTQVGAYDDFVTGYLKHLLGFLGITDIQIVAADQQVLGGEEVLAKAHDQISAVAA